MKIKMVKMGMDIDETRNHRIRGIIPTEDEKYLFIEILQGTRPDRRYTNLSQKEYQQKYPNEEYIWIDGCFRVDIPEDYRKNYTSEFKKYDRKSFPKLKHTKENIVKLLQQFNKNIEDIELTDEYYLDKFCEERGFFRLYDDRLKHSYEPLQIIWSDLQKGGRTDIKFLYICYASNGTEYKEEIKEKKLTDELIKEYGKEKIQSLVEKYIDEKCQKVSNPEFREDYMKSKKELFDETQNELDETLDIDY